MKSEFFIIVIIGTDISKTGSCLPILWKSSGSCTSTFSLWNMWYSACSQIGGIWLNCRATEYASYSQHMEQFHKEQSSCTQHKSQVFTKTWSIDWRIVRKSSKVYLIKWPVSVYVRTHHDLHGGPPRCPPVHCHSLVNHMGHCPHRFYRNSPN